MIEAKEFPGELFESKEDLFKKLKENSKALIAQKKMITKETDAYMVPVLASGVSKEGAIKAEGEAQGSPNSLSLKIVLNTTKLFDSHSDVHIDGLWNKTLKEKRDLYLLQEHKANFANVISDQVKASVQQMDWKDLGADYAGSTQALIFDANLERKDNPFMFDKYASGKVKQHSVGMRYVKILLAINSDDKYYAEELENYEKYIGEVANRDEVEVKGYFWAVLEAKLIEGSAVLLGSNPITPTLETESKEPPEGTPKTIEPPQGTQFDLRKAINELDIKF